MTQRVLSLGFVLSNLDDFLWNQWIYIKVGTPINVNAKCIVINPDECDICDDGFTPCEARDLRMEEFISIQDVFSVKEHILKSCKDYKIEDFVQALQFFIERDSFT